jgi:ADP-ribosylglycohydrolase
VLPRWRRHFIDWLHDPENTRAPGNTCLRACAGLDAGVPWVKATQHGSKGCGANMRVAPVGLVPGLSDEPPSPTCRIVLPGLEEVPAGPHPSGLRVRTGRLDGTPFTVLGHEGRLADLDLAVLSAGTSQPVVGLEVPGGGEPFTWAHALSGEITATGRGQGAGDLLAAARPLGNVPGLFFGG